ncbi:MAG: hypothetical protein KGL39_45375 [Patescibacteria group bacterium]|nr:hypothetical protein [Patescibacteria group bacterium]
MTRTDPFESRPIGLAAAVKAAPAQPTNKWTSTAGPLQTKRANAALQKLRWEATNFIQRDGVLGGDERETVINSPFGTQRTDCIEALRAIGQQFHYQLTPDNLNAVITAAETKLAELIAARPVEDNRLTPAQVAERDAKNAAFREQREAKAAVETSAKQLAFEATKQKYPWAVQTGSNQARAAKNIKRLLTDTFPGTEFRCSSESFSGGDSVSIRYTDGPSPQQVGQVIAPFESGHFDGMDDSYNYDHHAGREGFRQWMGWAKYISSNRRFSPTIEQAIVRALCEHEQIPAPADLSQWATELQTVRVGDEWFSMAFNRLTHELEVPRGATVKCVDLAEGKRVVVFSSPPSPPSRDTSPPVLGAAGPTGGNALVTMTENTERDGVELKFAAKPAANIIASVKGAGFRWSGRQSLWYARRTPKTLAFAQQLAGVVPDSPCGTPAQTPAPAGEPPRPFIAHDKRTGQDVLLVPVSTRPTPSTQRPTPAPAVVRLTPPPPAETPLDRMRRRAAALQNHQPQPA